MESARAAPPGSPFSWAPVASKEVLCSVIGPGPIALAIISSAGLGPEGSWWGNQWPFRLGGSSGVRAEVPPQLEQGFTAAVDGGQPGTVGPEGLGGRGWLRRGPSKGLRRRRRVRHSCFEGLWGGAAPDSLHQASGDPLWGRQLCGETFAR